jgi:serine/threonine protein kinase
MEYIPNGTLKNMMEPDASNHKKKRFTDYESSQIIGGLLSAVDHVHSKNYVHRDLKPENVLIGDPRTTNLEIVENKTAIEIKLEEASDLRRSIKLADFGLSASFRIS